MSVSLKMNTKFSRTIINRMDRALSELFFFLQDGGTGIVLANVQPNGAATNAVAFGQVLSVEPSVMSLLGRNTALGRSLVIEDVANGNQPAACAAL